MLDRRIAVRLQTTSAISILTRTTRTLSATCSTRNVPRAAAHEAVAVDVGVDVGAEEADEERGATDAESSGTSSESAPQVEEVATTMPALL